MHDDLTGALLDTSASAGDAGAIRFRQARDFGDTINVTFRFLRENARELGKGLLFIAGPLVLLAGIGSFLVQGQMLDLMTGVNTSPTDPLASFRMFSSPAYWLTILLGMLAPFIVMVVTFAYVRLYRQGEAGGITPSRLWEEARGLIGPLLRAYLLVMLGFVMVGAALVAAVAAVAGIAVQGAAGAGAIALTLFVGMLLYFVAAVYLFPVLGVMFVARTDGETSAWTAFRASRALVRGHWGQTFGVLFIAWFLLMIAVMAVSMVSSVPAAVSAVTTPGGPTGLSRTLMTISTILGMVLSFAYALPFTAHVFQYHNLAEQREGAGLGADVAALATRPVRTPEGPDGPFVRRPSPSEAPPAPARAEAPASESAAAPSESDGGPGAPPTRRGFQGGGFGSDEAPATRP